MLISNPDIRSDRLYGYFSLGKTLTLQAGATVFRYLSFNTYCICQFLHLNCSFELLTNIIGYVL